MLFQSTEADLENKIFKDCYYMSRCFDKNFKSSLENAKLPIIWLLQSYIK